MKFSVSVISTLLVATTLGLPFALPAPREKRDLVTLDVDPSVDANTLNDLCIGIAVCNPVTVTNTGS
ncbi:hypothetical protein BDZ45DRAFT_807085 [Acephala macrosclerotiorum]|nr:hypothetical protein BDZ45DRAFT_807085 [Acephala macrosclerotiorum]